MKKIIASLALVTVLASCGNSGTSSEAPVVDSTNVDTTNVSVDSVKVDTVATPEVK
jgi:ABC-type glycerol-3-phosphate transport system substrate-binding protein